MQGIIESVDDGSPVAADVVFTAIGITDQAGALNTNNFELAARAEATQATPASPAAYGIILPQGTYRVSVRPRDGLHQITTVPLTVEGATTVFNVAVAVSKQVVGVATVTDGRPLAGGEVEAVGVACSDGGASPWCLPRQANVFTEADGSFQLSLDPGQYKLTVRPADGTRLPWVVSDLSIGGADGPRTLAPILVPAPASAGVRLVDPEGLPVVSALVRAFSVPSTGPAVEVGRGLTNGDGYFDMYLSPPSP
jgi:hypothetical protein